MASYVTGRGFSIVDSGSNINILTYLKIFKAGKIERILTMFYDAQNYWGSGICPSSGIKTLEHDVSETGSVFG
jgi:hypothetical protein